MLMTFTVVWLLIITVRNALMPTDVELMDV